MAVTEQDVRHVAALARLGIDSSRAGVLATELNGILQHMEVLQAVDTSSVDVGQGSGATGMPLRADDGAQYPLARPLDAFAPSVRDGFMLVPRLGSHEHLEGSEDGGENDAGGAA